MMLICDFLVILVYGSYHTGTIPQTVVFRRIQQRDV